VPDWATSLVGCYFKISFAQCEISFLLGDLFIPDPAAQFACVCIFLLQSGMSCFRGATLCEIKLL